MISKTKLDTRLKRKANPVLVETIFNTKKNPKWYEVSTIIARSRRSHIALNLNQINKEAKDGETIIIPGKVLSQGEVTKKIKIVALSFSETAKEKLKTSKIEMNTIIEEIKKNPKAEGVRILK